MNRQIIKNSPQYQWPQGALHGTSKFPKQIGHTSSAGGFSINNVLHPASVDVVGGGVSPFSASSAPGTISLSPDGAAGTTGAVVSPPPLVSPLRSDSGSRFGLTFRVPEKKRVRVFIFVLGFYISSGGESIEMGRSGSISACISWEEQDDFLGYQAIVIYNPNLDAIHLRGVINIK